MFKKRIYKSGTNIQWCLWRWSDAQEPYLTRLFLVKTPWWAISMNWIKCADIGFPHDHTSNFLSIFIRGWYIERRIIKDRDFFKKRRWYNYVRGCDWDAHRILKVSPNGGSLSICFMGPKLREWYYHTPDGPVHWSKAEELNE